MATLPNIRIAAVPPNGLPTGGDDEAAAENVFARLVTLVPEASLLPAGDSASGEGTVSIPAEDLPAETGEPAQAAAFLPLIEMQRSLVVTSHPGPQAAPGKPVASGPAQIAPSGAGIPLPAPPAPEQASDAPPVELAVAPAPSTRLVPPLGAARPDGPGPMPPQADGPPPATETALAEPLRAARPRAEISSPSQLAARPGPAPESSLHPRPAAPAQGPVPAPSPVEAPAPVLPQPATVQAALHGPQPLPPTPQAQPVAPQAASLAERLMEYQLDLAGDGEWLDQLARDIARTTARDGALRFRLNPESLGTLKVELAQTAQGTTIRLTAETEAARAIIADAQPRLLAEARAQGVRVAETHVDLGPGGGQAGDPRDRRHDREPFVEAARAAPAARSDPDLPRSRASERYA